MTYQKIIFLLVGVVVLAVSQASCSSGSSSREPKIVEVSAEPSATLPGRPHCSPDEIPVLPGEAVRFIVHNTAPQSLEFIVTDGDGLKLRQQEVAQVAQISSTSEGAIIQKIHDGHEDETSPHATDDYRYRLIVPALENGREGVRNMLVTFPDASEPERLEYFLCSYLDSLEIDEGTFPRR